MDVDTWVQTCYGVSVIVSQNQNSFLWLKFHYHRKKCSVTFLPISSRENKLNAPFLTWRDSSLNYFYDEFGFYSDKSCSSPKQLFPLVVLYNSVTNTRRQGLRLVQATVLHPLWVVWASTFLWWNASYQQSGWSWEFGGPGREIGVWVL